MARVTTEASKAAAAIRKMLKANKISAKVSTKHGTTVWIDINQDILPATRSKIDEALEDFRGGRFNGMEDIYEYSAKSGPTAKFVFMSVNYSDDFISGLNDYCERTFSGLEGMTENDIDLISMRNQVLSGHCGDSFWTAQKQRVAA